MIDHLSFGVSDVAKSIVFYDAVLETLGIVRVWRYNDAAGYGYPGHDDAFAIKQSTTSRAGSDVRSHVAFVARSRAAVIAFHAVAMMSGATDEGRPELCPIYGAGYFAAFVRDPDGHRLEAVIHERG